MVTAAIRVFVEAVLTSAAEFSSDCQRAKADRAFGVAGWGVRWRLVQPLSLRSLARSRERQADELGRIRVGA